MKQQPKILTVVGNRPQFIKLGIVAHRMRARGDAAPLCNIVVNTGQHYDAMLSDVFFNELSIERPDYDLGIGSGPIVDQMGKMMAPLREIVEREAPDALLVFGDTNSTVAGALVAAHASIPVVHVEGGERLYRRRQMPEEVNRVVTDSVADLCLCSSRKALRYLQREGFHPDRAVFVGDPMYDLFVLSGAMLASRKTITAEDFGLKTGNFALSTLHRAENTDERETCLGILDAMDGAPMPVLLPVHPRLRARLDDWGWTPQNALRLTDPLGYFDFQRLLRDCAIAISDSGGVNREAFFAGKPCIVPLESCAWIEAIEAGFAIAAGSDPARLATALHEFRPTGQVTAIVEQEFGDGHASERIIDETAALIDARAYHGEGPWHPVLRYSEMPPIETAHGADRAIALVHSPLERAQRELDEERTTANAALRARFSV